MPEVCTIVIVDDSEDDRLLLFLALRQIPQGRVVASLPGGQAAIDYLSGKGAFADRGLHPIPDLLILDLKMPAVTGRDVLRWIKKRGMPNLAVIVMAYGFEMNTPRECHELGANLCLEKGDLAENASAIQSFLKSCPESRPAPSAMGRADSSGACET